MNTPIILKLTKEMAANSDYYNAFKCPIARALIALGHKHVIVFTYRAVVDDGDAFSIETTDGYRLGIEPLIKLTRGEIDTLEVRLTPVNPWQ